MKGLRKDSALVLQVLEVTRQLVAHRITELEKSLGELDEALKNAVPQNPMEDDSYREKLSEERLHLHGELARKEALLLHLRRMPVSCEASRVTSESVVFTEDRKILVILPEADGESFDFQDHKVSLMSTRAPLFQKIRDSHPGDPIEWKNGQTTRIVEVC